MLPEEERECFESGGDDVIEESEQNPTKQRRMAERRKDPIVAKNEGRKAKVNLNSFKSNTPPGAKLKNNLFQIIHLRSQFIPNCSSRIQIFL